VTEDRGKGAEDRGKRNRGQVQGKGTEKGQEPKDSDNDLTISTIVS
jgi:hypothetical protein